MGLQYAVFIIFQQTPIALDASKAYDVANVKHYFKFAKLT